MDKKIGLLLDTETIEGRQIYDFACHVIDVQGNVLASVNFINADLFNTNNFGLFFNSQFVSYEKYQWYEKAITSGKIPCISWQNIINELNSIISKYNVSFFTAYNITFDLTALAKTCDMYNVNSSFLYNRGLKYLDLWKLSKNHIATNAYNKYCISHDWITKTRKKPKTTAECIYRYIIKDDLFVESHRALNDCDIELTIYRKCKQKKKKIPANVYIKL